MKYKYAIVIREKLHKFSSNSKDQLVAEIVDFFNKEKWPYNVKDLQRAIDRQSRIKIAKKHHISFSQAVHGANAIIKNSVFGSSVSGREIERRAAICDNCPMNSSVGGCMSCGVGQKITLFSNKLRASVGASVPIPSSIKSKYCDHCGCALASMVVTKHENFYEESALENAKRPDCCWLKKTSPNFTHE